MKMIIDPDFLSHWKTRQIAATAGELAPLAVIALWSHCQNRKEDTFDLTDAKLRGICNFPDSGLLPAMVDAGFLDDCGGGTYTVHGWRERNRMITRMWGNSTAAKGSAAKPSRNEVVSKSFPSRNEVETTSIISNHISSNPISSSPEEGESEREEGGVTFAARFDHAAQILAPINPRWSPAGITTEHRRRALEDEAAFLTVTDYDLATILRFYQRPPKDEKLCGSLGAILASLPTQRDRAAAWATYRPAIRPNGHDLADCGPDPF